MTGANLIDLHPFTPYFPVSCQLSSLVIVVTFRRMPNENPANDKNPPQTQTHDSKTQAYSCPAQLKVYLAVDSLNLFPLMESNKR